MQKVRKRDGLPLRWWDWLRPRRAWRLRKARQRLIDMRSLDRERVGELVRKPGSAPLLRDVRGGFEPRGDEERRAS